MEKKVVKFKTSVVGFDRHDVIGYIKSLADERNELRCALEDKETQREELELEAWREAFELHAGELKQAEDVLHALEKKHEELGEQIRGMREHLEKRRAQCAENE